MNEDRVGGEDHPGLRADTAPRVGGEGAPDEEEKPRVGGEDEKPAGVGGEGDESAGDSGEPPTD